MPSFFSLCLVVTDLRAQCGRNAVRLDFTSVKKCAAVYLHTGKDHLWISKESTTCHIGVHFSIRTTETLLIFGIKCSPETLWGFQRQTRAFLKMRKANVEDNWGSRFVKNSIRTYFLLMTKQPRFSFSWFFF